ncbi:MAG: hypothetical protein IJG49_02675 [Erysipelotrichaceae bacterium]|nr:hypothetical protein [Erysipelotrichaceae bacterium]
MRNKKSLKGIIGKVRLFILPMTAFVIYATSSSNINIFKQVIINCDTRRDELAELVEIDIDSSLYTPESYERYSEELDKALEIMDTTIVDGNNIEITTEELKLVIDDLVPVTDRSGLNNYTEGKFRINCYATKQTDNHVGNELSYNYYLNGVQITSYQTVTYSIGGTATLGCEIVEDDNCPDKGYGSVQIVFEDGYETGFYVDVQEDRGQYAGNIETFYVTVKVTLLSGE